MIIKKLHDFFNNEWEKGLKNLPESATWYGDNRYNDKLNDRSLKSISLNHQNKLQNLKDKPQIQKLGLSFGVCGIS